jgi:WD40 repeat protein
MNNLNWNFQRSPPHGIFHNCIWRTFEETVAKIRWLNLHGININNTSIISAWNKQDHNFLATFAQGSNEIFILDIRIPSMPVSILKNHVGSVNGIAWAPHSACHLVTAGFHIHIYMSWLFPTRSTIFSRRLSGLDLGCSPNSRY